MQGNGILLLQNTMALLKSLLLYSVLLCLSWVSGPAPEVRATKNLSPEINFVGSTPGDELIKSALTIPVDSKIDFIRWDLLLTNTTSDQGTFSLTIIFGEGQPNTSGFKGGGEKLSFEGKYVLSKNKEINGDVYHLRSSKFSTEIRLAKLTPNLLHLLTPQNQLMVGNGGWSYTLNRKDPINTPIVLPAFTLSSTLRTDSAAQLTFDGRTPCTDFARDHNIIVPANCFKLKWRIILNRDPKTLLPTTYLIKRTDTRTTDSKGTWAIIKGISSSPNARIYQLDPDKPEKSLFLLAGDENVLFLLTKEKNLYVGNGDFSYTFNKKN